VAVRTTSEVEVEAAAGDLGENSMVAAIHIDMRTNCT
jgi:hypothetical protein